MNDPLDEIYQATIIERSRRPRHRGLLDPCDGRAHGHNPLCGDDLEITLRLDAAGRVAAVGFDGKGCAISQASADLMSGAAVGRSPEEVRALAEEFFAMVKARGADLPDLDRMGSLAAMAGVRRLPMRVKCATLAWHALLQALCPAIDATHDHGAPGGGSEADSGASPRGGGRDGDGGRDGGRAPDRPRGSA